jgi:hypothetical protein
MKSIWIRRLGPVVGAAHVVAIVVAVALWIGAVGVAGATEVEAPAAADSALVLQGDQDGTTFGSLTVEGENRVRIQFDRPSLQIDLDPREAPGLDLGSTMDVLDRTVPDLLSPFLVMSSVQPCPHLARPWLNGFATAPVARFRPEVEGVERWQLTVADSRGRTVAAFEGNEKPPQEIAWDGLSLTGEPAPPGLTYSYAFEAYDRAGNKRSFAGPSFQLPAYRVDSGGGTVMLIAGAKLRERGEAAFGSVAGAGTAAPHPLLQEAASWLNLTTQIDTPLRIEVTARSYGEAEELGQKVLAAIEPLLAGDPARISVVTNVQAEAAEMGVAAIRAGAW